VEKFASGRKRNYYGKADVVVYRLRRDGMARSGEAPVFGANMKMLVYGDSFWPTYTSGDNTGLIATDSMKNFIQREALNYAEADLEGWCSFIGTKFLETYPQVEGVQVSANEIPYSGLNDTKIAFVPSGPEQATARIEMNRSGTVEVASGIRGFKLLRLGGSAFQGFVRDRYTTLPDVTNRPLHMWLDLEWFYIEHPSGFGSVGITSAVRRLVHLVFSDFESGSIQQVIYQIGTKILAEIPAIGEIHLEANNRTWDAVVECDPIGIYTESRPPYGCLGLTLRR
jgi:urate oxidase/2-oxo-4-hydroxy-4-carboxy-5-ureidoimidazoline decarboxylase